MEIFYLNKNEFLNAVDINSLKNFSDERKYSSETKYLEHLCGIFLTKFVAKNIYGMHDCEIILQNNKPIFKSEKIHFNISHSENIVMVGFNDKPIGIDIEYMKNRNFKELLAHYNQNSIEPTKENFYEFWTLHEAKIKLQMPTKSVYHSVLENNYALACVSAQNLPENFKINKLNVNSDTKIDLNIEFINPKFINFTQTV